MGNCTGSPADISKRQQEEQRAEQKPADRPAAEGIKSEATKPVPIRKSFQRRRSRDSPAQRISADCKRMSGSTDLSRGSLEDMYKMSCHPEVNNNEGLAKSGPDDMSTMYMSHMDRVMDLPKDSSKAFNLKGRQ